MDAEDSARVGLPIDRDSFEPAAYERFADRLDDCLDALADLLATPGFGRGERTVGAELEVSVVDAGARALLLDRSELPSRLDEHVTLEVDRFNLEYNLSPLRLAGRPFSALEAQLDRALRVLGNTVAPRGGRVAPIGILPTLDAQDLQSHAMTDLPRYRALSKALRQLRGEPFALDIDGPEPLRHRCDDVTLEGAATSFQVHLRAEPDEFGRLYNAAQLITPPVLAACTNSPVFLEHLLWDETRIALFKQSIDARSPGSSWRAPARVSFGHGWVHDGAYELFAESVALFPPLLPVTSREQLPPAAGDGVPRLEELRLHQGTVWRWNRAIYDPADGGHLRIELRALPSGPTPVDMAANAAFLIGATLGLADELPRMLPGFPFEYAQLNFYRAARSGLDARQLWPAPRPPSPRETSARALVDELLPVAERGLASGGVDAQDISRMLGIVADRAASGLTAARWQRTALDRLSPGSTRPRALRAMLEAYLEGLASRRPVHQWPLP